MRISDLFSDFFPNGDIIDFDSLMFTIENMDDIDVSVYRDIILSLIYLKHINDLKEDQLLGASNLVIPELAEWNNIYKLSKQGSIITCLNNAFNELEFQNPKLKDVFAFLNITNNTNDLYFIRNLNSIFRAISFIKIPLNDFGQFFDSILYKLIKNDSKQSGEFIQPKELTELMNSFIPKKENLTIYNPFAGFASLALNLPENSRYFGQELISKTWALAKLRLLAYNISDDYELSCEDSINSWRKNLIKKFDYITFNPPYNIRLRGQRYHEFYANKYFNARNANSLIVDECFKRLNHNGSMVFIMPDSFLYSRAKVDKNLRKFLVENNYINTIISLPTRLLGYTSISVNLIVLSNKDQTLKDHSILFVDASNYGIEVEKRKQKLDVSGVIKLINSDITNEFKRLVRKTELIENDLILNPKRYLIPEIKAEDNNELVSLGNLITSTARIPRESFFQKLSGSISGSPTESKFIKITDLANDSRDIVKTFENLNSGMRFGSKISLLSNNSLLLALKGGRLKPTYFSSSSKSIYYSLNDIFACKINKNLIDKEYLIYELNKEYVEVQVKKYKDTLGIAIKDLLKIKIQLPSLKIQQEKIFFQKNKILQKEEEKFVNLRKEYGIAEADENSFLRHKIAGVLKNLRGSFSKLNNIIDNQIAPNLPGVYNFKVDERLDSNLSDYLKRMDRDIKTIHNSVQFVGIELNLNEIKLEPIDFIGFLKGYIEEVKNRATINFDIKIDVDEEALKEHKIKKITIEGDKEFLRQAFDNIIENAEKHAFQNSFSSKNKISVELYFDFEKSYVQIDFYNTGKRLPQDFSLEAFIRKGSKSGANAGDGTGGWLINEVVKKHKGTFGFVNLRNDDSMAGEYVTQMLLTFPIEVKL